VILYARRVEIVKVEIEKQKFEVDLAQANFSWIQATFPTGAASKEDFDERAAWLGIAKKRERKTLNCDFRKNQALYEIARLRIANGLDMPICRVEPVKPSVPGAAHAVFMFILFFRGRGIVRTLPRLRLCMRYTVKSLVACPLAFPPGRVMALTQWGRPQLRFPFVDRWSLMSPFIAARVSSASGIQAGAGLQVASPWMQNLPGTYGAMRIDAESKRSRSVDGGDCVPGSRAMPVFCASTVMVASQKGLISLQLRAAVDAIQRSGSSSVVGLVVRKLWMSGDGNVNILRFPKPGGVLRHRSGLDCS
jgi:hypothetical protein